ncbi:MAG: DUF2213 domain-containing protein [Pseudomonadota bacterium]|nr:DUF2213 domain-containing protein [Pseudomonadota bacterium]
MFFADRLTLDAPKRTRDGFLAVRARSARTGVYQYAGRDVDPDNQHGLRDKAVVNVLRDEATVFDAAAVQSFIGKPVTDDHPSDPVTAANWRDHARGTVMGALRDGEYLAFDLLLTDAATIAKVDAGKRELSNGYGAELEFGSFTAPDGTICDARQAKITAGNHVALVDRGRAGPECAIKDGFARCDAMTADELHRLKASMTDTKGTAVKKIMLDGLQVDLSDADAVSAAFDKLQNQLKDATEAKDKALADVATLTTDKATLDARVTTLEKQVADAKLTPQQLRDAAKAYAQVCDKAKALGLTVSDDMDEPAIMKAAVSAKIGDAAKDWNDAQIAASFATLTADVQSSATVPNGIKQPMVANDAASLEDAAYQAMVGRLTGKKQAA